MSKHIGILLIIVALCSSCQFLDKTPSEQELLDQRIKEINWQKVDKFPSINNCDVIENAAEQKKCFFDCISQIIEDKISLDTLLKLYPNIDTVAVKVTVFPNATLKFEPQLNPDLDSVEKQKIDSIFHARLVGFPRVQPAIKRGIPVKTQFTIPVVLNNK